MHSCLYCCCRFHRHCSRVYPSFYRRKAAKSLTINYCVVLILFNIHTNPHLYCCLCFLPSLGAQIIDLMMLVVDVVKGVQTQTAECLLIGELTCPRMVVVLNKIDLLPPNKRQSAIEKMTKRLHKTLESTRSVFNISKRNNRDKCRRCCWERGLGHPICFQWPRIFCHSPLSFPLCIPAVCQAHFFFPLKSVSFQIIYTITSPSKHEIIAACFFFLLARFKECPVIAVAAKPGGPEAPDTEEPQGVPELIEVMFGNTLVPSIFTDEAQNSSKYSL